MKKQSTFLFISLSVAAMSPQTSYAQMDLPFWLQPSWIQAKLTDFHARNVERYESVQNKAANNSANATNNTANTSITATPTATAIATSNTSNATTNNGTLNPQAVQPSLKQTVALAPVETAVPKLNEKHLTADELKELRRQLRQQR
jgi:hypothetical protein